MDEEFEHRVRDTIITKKKSRTKKQENLDSHDEYTINTKRGELKF